MCIHYDILTCATTDGRPDDTRRRGTTDEYRSPAAAPEPDLREPRRRRDTVINVRLTKMLRDLIDRAADVVGKTRSEFILESARTHAIDVLLDRRLFTLHAEQYEAFIRTLEAPPEPNEKLKAVVCGQIAMGEVTRLPVAQAALMPPAPILPEHDLSQFDCGKIPLNDWLRRFAPQKRRARLALLCDLFKQDRRRLLLSGGWLR